MQILKSLKIFPVLVGILAFGLLISGCDTKNESQGSSAPPALPPISSFLMNFTAFPVAGNGGKVAAQLEFNSTAVLTQKNWTYAAGNVFIWNAFITIGLAVPVLAFGESFNHEPEQQSNGRWLWTYDFAEQYTAKLYGSTANNMVNWEMYISKIGDFSDFLWYSGNSDLLVTNGTWTINDNPQNKQPLLGIEWNRNLDNSTADIKYTNIAPGGPKNGDYIFYGKTTDSQLDAFYDIYNKGQDSLTNIEWNRSSKAGRVKDQRHFEDTAWRCWDNQLFDSECQF